MDRPTKELLTGMMGLIVVVTVLQTIVYSYAAPSCQRTPPAPVNNRTLLPTLHAVLCVRIYAEDPPQWSRHELEQWLQYMQYAGVSRVYLYDARHNEDESLAAFAAQHEDSVTYIGPVTTLLWHSTPPYLHNVHEDIDGQHWFARAAPSH